MDSAFEVLSQTANSQPPQMSAPPQPTNTGASMIDNMVHHQSNTTAMMPNHMLAPNVQHNSVLHDDHVSKCVPPTMNSLPVNIPERKFEISTQYYPNIKKKRKMEEAGFYRPPVMDKRTVFENMPNEHALLTDNYSTFDCNLSWLAPPISTGAAPATKWWT